MWVAICFGLLGAALAITVLVAPPGNQLDDRFDLWQNLARLAATLGLVALLGGAVAAFRRTNGLVAAVVPGGIAVIAGCAALVLLTTLPYGH
jgi:hypothetical protein